MNLIDRWCLNGTTAVSRPLVVRRLTRVEGLANLPLQGPFVLVSNHLSFADHFVYDTLLFAVRGDQGAFLTKAESFVGLRGRWFRAVGAIPVDRDAPARASLLAADRVLSAGRVLVVYPEGTRNPRPPLLDFKDGGFRFAVRAEVPVVPAALWGTQDVLPVGSRMPRTGQIRVAIGAPLRPDPGLPRPARIRDLTARAQAAVADLYERARDGSGSSAGAAEEITRLAEQMTERSLTADRPAVGRLRRQVELLLDIALAVDPDCLAAQVAATRLLGLRALDGSLLTNAVRLFRVRAGAERVLRQHPSHGMANYLLGRWHLATPPILGGRKSRAVHHLAAAVAADRDDSRFAIAYAEALLADGRTREAVPLLDLVAARTANTPREQARRERAARLAHHVRSTSCVD